MGGKKQGHLLAFIAKDKVERSIPVRYESRRLALSSRVVQCTWGEIKNKTPINKTELGAKSATQRGS